MAALTCSCSPAVINSSWKEAAVLEESKVAKVAAEEAAYEEAKTRSKGEIISRRRSKEEGAEGEEGEVWEGLVSREVGAGVEEVWEMLGEFSGMKKWNAIAEVCELVEGREGEVGCVRYCAGGGRWVKEKLLELEPKRRRFTYTITESSYGFQGYVATLSILPLLPARTLVHWTFQLDPVPHFTPSKLLDLLTFIFDRMMCSLEDTILSASSNPANSAPADPEVYVTK